MASKGNGPARRSPLIAALKIAIIPAAAILLYYFVALPIKNRIGQSIQLSRITSTVEPTATPTPTPAATPTATPTAGATETPTVETFPAPRQGIIGINLPDDFSVGPWHDNSIVCDKNPNHFSVTIYGVEISGGAPPYEIRLWQFNKEIPANAAIFFKRYVVFTDPVEVTKDEYVHVIITFQSGNAESEWVDDIFYPYRNDPRCAD